MPIDINRGEIANRLRRFLGIVGRIPTRLDETVVPVSVLASVDDPPWRRSPIIFADWMSQAGVAAENSIIAISLPPSDFGVMVVHRVIVDNLSGSTAANIDLVMHSHAAMAATLTAGPPQARRYEILDPQAIIGGAAQPSGVLMLQGSELAAGYPLFGARIDQGRVFPSALGLTRLQFNGPFVIPAGGALYVGRATVNETLNAHFYGEYYPDVPSNPNV